MSLRHPSTDNYTSSASVCGRFTTSDKPEPDSPITTDLPSEVGTRATGEQEATEEEVVYLDSVLLRAGASPSKPESLTLSQRSCILPEGSDSDVKFSSKELEEIYLARRSRELTIEVGKEEEELGRHLTSCVRSIRVLNALHEEVFVVRSRQALISNGASQERGFEYERDMQHKIAIFYSSTSMADSRSRHEPSLSTQSRKLRLLGHSFYIHPSLLSTSFNRLWNSLWSRSS